MKPSYVIVGASLAGASAAESLRDRGFEGRVVLVGAEKHLPYQRPPLSKGVLTGRQTAKDTAIRTAEYYSQREIDVLSGRRVMSLIGSERAVELDGGERVEADKVLLCTGGVPRELPVTGAGLDGVSCLRTIEDAAYLADRLCPGASVVIVGAGFIGSEVAASAATNGCRVTLLEIGEVPMERAIGRTVGSAFAAQHRDHGVDLRTSTGVDRIEGDRSGRVKRVVTTRGDVVEADVVVLGLGIRPAHELARAAGIATEDGILVDAECRTSSPEVFAAGDVARQPAPMLGGHCRFEHFRNAQVQGAAAAAAMLGQASAAADVPWFWSDQYDLNLQMAGWPGEGDEVVWRGSVEAMSFSAFYLRHGVLVGATSVNRPTDVRAAMKLIAGGLRMDGATLSDESTDLRRLVKDLSPRHVNRQPAAGDQHKS